MSCAPSKTDRWRGARQAALVGVLTALLTGAKMALSALPNIEIVTLLLAVYTITLGVKPALYTAVVFTLLQVSMYGVHTYVVMYLVLWPALVLLTALVQRILSRLRGRGKWGTGLYVGGHALIQGLFGLLFGLLCALIEACFYASKSGYWPYFWAYWTAGLTFDLMHGAGNFALTLVLFYPIEQAFLRIGKRLRLLQKR